MGGSGSANRPMEFEINRNQYMRDPSRPDTVTVMFKDAPQDMEAEAWRILMAVVAECFGKSKPPAKHLGCTHARGDGARLCQFRPVRGFTYVEAAL